MTLIANNFDIIEQFVMSKGDALWTWACVYAMIDTLNINRNGNQQGRPLNIEQWCCLILEISIVYYCINKFQNVKHQNPENAFA